MSPRALLALALLAACRGAPHDAGRDGAIPRDAAELVVALADDWTSTHVTLARYRRSSTGGWTQLGRDWPGVVGKAGLAWGIGLHGRGAPAGRGGPTKREGDGASPAGAFALRAAYGDATTPPAGAKLAYQSVAEGDWQCVDDPASPAYASIVSVGKLGSAAATWTSHEDLHRPDGLYRWVIDLAHNPDHVANAGSCIFLHVWRGPDSTTVGCTAMAEPELAMLVGTLDPSAIFVLLPRAEYAALAPGWHLPAR